MHSIGEKWIKLMMEILILTDDYLNQLDEIIQDYNNEQGSEDGCETEEERKKEVLDAWDRKEAIQEMCNDEDFFNYKY